MSKIKEKLKEIEERIAFLKDEVKSRFPEGYWLRKKLQSLKAQKMGLKWQLSAMDSLKT